MIHGLSQPNGHAQIGDTGSNSALDQISEILPQLFGIYLFGEQVGGQGSDVRHSSWTSSKRVMPIEIRNLVAAA